MRLRDIFSIRALPVVAAICLTCVTGTEAFAQQSGHNVAGDAGLQSGSQLPPGVYVGNLLYVYPTDKLKGEDGKTFDGDGKLTVSADAIFVNWVTNAKIFGANVGGQIAVPFIKNRIEAFSLDVSSELGVSDVYVQPVNLGWHFKRADVITGYAVTFPTGDYEPGGKSNKGLGMFSHELSLGSTVYLNQTKTWHASALMGYEMHARKPGIDVKVGDLVTVEGGIGKTFLKMLEGKGPVISNLGIVGYAQFKATEDSGTGISPLLRGRKDRVFALGPELNVLIPYLRTSVGVRYLPEFGAQNTTQGQAFVVTLAFIAKSLTPPPSAQAAPPSN